EDGRAGRIGGCSVDVIEVAFNHSVEYYHARFWRLRMANGPEKHAVVSHDEWLAAQKAFLTKEKEFTHQREELSRQRRALPWEKVEKQYFFEGPDGTESLSDLFGDKHQLVVY